MSGRALIGWGLAGVVSLGLHGVVAAMTQAVAPEPAMDGGAVAGEVALGSSFTDLVQGLAEPVKPQPAQRAAPVQAEPAKPLTPPEVAPKVVAKPLADPPVQAVNALSPKRLTRAAVKPLVEPVKPRARAVALPVSAPAPAVTPAKSVTQVRTGTAIKPIEPELGAMKAPTAKTLTARDEPPKKAPPKKPTPKPAAKGNAKNHSKSGTSDGKSSGKLAEKSSKAAKTKAKQAGDGALRSYQRSVLRKIARVPKRRAGGRGKALVGMVIAPGGAIASLRIVRSSGDGGVDRMALDTVRRAGPFGPTPDARQIKLVVELKSEG